MRLVLFLVLCLIWQVYAEPSSKGKRPRKKYRSISAYIYPYFDLSLGGMTTNTSYKKKSEYNWYFDKEKDEMIYDKDLYYDIASFEGKGFDVDFKGGLVVFREFLPVTLAAFLNFAVFQVDGSEKYKYYSRDKEERHRDEARSYTQALLGVMVYPVKSENSLFHGMFVSTAFGMSVKDNKYHADGVAYSDEENIVKIELGNVWSMSEHYYMGLVGKIVLGFCDNDDIDYKDDVFLNSKSLGLALKVVRK
ncbi:MAG: hypothetical protein IKS02_02040 [Fibrobacter sp.]|nr:hypothetical protein [Fibrobacter sp.]